MRGIGYDSKMETGELLACRQACFEGDLEAARSLGPDAFGSVGELTFYLSGVGQDKAPAPSANLDRDSDHIGLLALWRSELLVLAGFAELVAARFPRASTLAGGASAFWPSGRRLVELLQGFQCNKFEDPANIPSLEEVFDLAPDIVQRILLLGTSSFAHSTAARAEDAVGFAREAMRLAQKNRLPLLEYFAACALARGRRVSGRAHLAEWILGALQNYAPAAWSPLIDYELQMARGQHPSADVCQTFPGFEKEQATLSLLLQEKGEETGLLKDWYQGRSSRLPYGLQSFQDPEWSRLHGCFGSIALDADRPARRVFLSRETKLPVSELFQRKKRSAGIVSLLALSPRDIAVPEFFQKVYGFAYASEKHRGVVDTAVRDARRLLNGLPVEIIRTDGSVHLRAHGPCTIPDIRCKLDLDDRVLKMLAENKRLSAGELAERLDVPLRSLQRALSEMADSGFCVSARQGRHRTYRLVDTTFSPPTRFR